MADDNSTNTLPFPEVRQIMRVSNEPALIEDFVYYRGKSGGYLVERTSIRSILVRLGRVVEPRWNADWTEVAPGIETRSENRGTRTTLGSHSQETHISGSLRIYSGACPVHVKILKTWEYNDYEDDSFSSMETDVYWVRFEAEKS